MPVKKIKKTKVDPRELKFKVESVAGRKQHIILEGKRAIYKGPSSTLDDAKYDLIFQILRDVFDRLDSIDSLLTKSEETIASLKNELNNTIPVELVE